MNKATEDGVLMTEGGLGGEVEVFLRAVAPRYAATSLEIYRSSLKSLVDFGEQAKLQGARDMTDETLRDFEFWMNLNIGGLAEATVYLKLRSAKLFLQWAHSAGLTLWDGESFSLPNPESRIPKPPTVAVMKRLLELPNLKRPGGLRDQFALELLYSLGLRRAECCRLNLSDLDLTEDTLRVVGKGGDERLLPVSEPLKFCAQNYLFEARPKMLRGFESEALFVTHLGERLSGQSLNNLVKKYGKKLGLKISTHHLRHACATHLTEQGMELGSVQQLLGHRNISSTKRYAQISNRELELEFHRVARRSRGD